MPKNLTNPYREDWLNHLFLIEKKSNYCKDKVYNA